MKHLLLILFGISFLQPALAQKGGLFQRKVRAEDHRTMPRDSASAQINVYITLMHYYPYCGGAYPTDDQMNDYQPQSGSFLLINLESGEKQVVTTHENGTLRLNLSPGNYGLKETFKDCSYEQFIQNYPLPQGMYIETDTACYKTWWAFNFMEFTVTAVQTELTLSHTFYDRCFTGDNPCINYFGPYPP